MPVTQKCSRLSKSWTKAYSNGDNCHHLICSFSAFSGMLSTKIFKNQSTAEYRSSLFLPSAYFACSDVFKVWIKKCGSKEKNGNIEGKIHNVDRGDVGAPHEGLLALPSSKPCKKGFVSGLYLKKRRMVVCTPTPPNQHIFISKHGVKGKLSGNFSLQYIHWKLIGRSCQEGLR